MDANAVLLIPINRAHSKALKKSQKTTKEQSWKDCFKSYSSFVFDLQVQI